MDVDIVFLVNLIFALVAGLTFHEFAHAWMALRLGDDSAAQRQRLTLNPLKHVSMLGTLALFVIGVGWAKPVPVNTANFSRPRLYHFYTSMAGPAANLIIAGLALAAVYIVPYEPLKLFLRYLFMVNAGLALLNLIPIPPLDGSSIWPLLFPNARVLYSPKWRMAWFAVLIIAIYTGAVGAVLGPTLGFLRSLLP